MGSSAWIRPRVPANATGSSTSRRKVLPRPQPHEQRGRGHAGGRRDSNSAAASIARRPGPWPARGLRLSRAVPCGSTVTPSGCPGSGRLQTHVVDRHPAIGLIARVDPQAIDVLARPAPLPGVVAAAAFRARVLGQIQAVGGPAFGDRELAAQAPASVGAFVVDVQHVGLVRGVQADGQPGERWASITPPGRESET